jgi:Amidohydrolase family
MKYASVAVLSLAIAGGVLNAQTAFTNGLWFDGNRFTRRVAYAVDGNLTFRRPAHVASTIDLAGAFVVPPFGEAHNHNVESLSRIDPLVQRYLRHGIFYVKNPNGLPGTREQLAGKINTPSSIDVVFSNGGFTGTGGHPVEFVDRNIKRGIWTGAEGEGKFYYQVDTPQALDGKWPQLLNTKPDFIKTYLLFSEEYTTRRDSKEFFGWKGLDPALLALIVRKAHAAGLRVSTHLETAADFHNALLAGVDEINHMPGFRKNQDVRPHPDSIFEISADDAARAAKQRTFVATTLGEVRAVDPNGKDGVFRREQDRLNIRNLRLLHEHHVKLALGSDEYRGDTLTEALYIEALHVFDNRTLLNIWCTSTAETIFPKRKIGRLREGYEASFLSLEGDPLRDFSNVTKIKLRVKQGHVLTIPAE